MEHRVTFEQLTREGLESLAVEVRHRIVLHFDKIESTVALDQLRGMAEKRGKPFFITFLMRIFGTDLAKERYEQLYDDVCSGAFVHPPIKVRPWRHLGAYNRRRQEIEVNRAMALAAAEGEPEAQWTLLVVLIEEFGHHVDHWLRGGEGDASRDEGARFGYSLLNLGWQQRSRFTYGTHIHGYSGQRRPLEVDWSELEEFLESLAGEDAQASDDRDEEREYFGAGLLDHEHNSHSWGHQAIEEAIVRERRGSRVDAREIYFGNWLRDMSNAITPQTEQYISPETIATVIHYMAHGKFGQHTKYDVTPEILGRYRYEEHVDHPFGNPGANSASYAIDPSTLLPRYIGVGAGAAPLASPGFPTTAGYLCQELQAAVQLGRGPQGHRRLGQAFHVLEDYYAHSNFAELTLIGFGCPVFPWTHQRIADVAPIVTGTFGGLDTAVSVLLGLAEKLARLGECEFYADEPSWMMKAAFTLVGDILRGRVGSVGNPEAVESLWNEHADRMQSFLHHAYQQGWLNDDPIRHAAARAVTRVAGYLLCRVSEEVSRFGAAVLATVADMIAVRVIGHEVHFDGTAASVLGDIGNELSHMQTAVAGAGEFPTHSQLAKDHDDHPLHDLAAQMAVRAVGTVYDEVRRAWAHGGRDASAVCQTALGFLVHPRRITNGSPASALLQFAAGWASSNPERVLQAGSPTWVSGHRHLWEETRLAARRITSRLVGEDVAESYLRLVEEMLRDGAH